MLNINNSKGTQYNQYSNVAYKSYGFPFSVSSRLQLIFYPIMLKRHTCRFLLTLLCVLTLTTLTLAQNKKTVPAQRDTSKTVQLTAPATPAKGPKPYKDVITEKAISRKGIISVHKIEEKWFFEIGDSLLSRDILMVNRIAKAPANTRSGFFGYAGDEINQNVIRFEKYLAGLERFFYPELK